MNHLDRIENALERYGLDAMLLTSDPNCFWATYFHGPAERPHRHRSGHRHGPPWHHPGHPG